jgi:hypothetical protein
MTTSIELFLVHYNDHKNSFDYVHEILELSGINPDQIVADYLKQHHSAVEGRYLLHSTSWHYEIPDKILLTYVVISEMFKLSSPASLDQPSVLRGTWQKPRPINLNKEHVLSHGLRHVSYLLREKPVPEWITPKTLRALQDFHPDVAGKI